MSACRFGGGGTQPRLIRPQKDKGVSEAVQPSDHIRLFMGFVDSKKNIEQNNASLTLAALHNTNLCRGFYICLAKTSDIRKKERSRGRCTEQRWSGWAILPPSLSESNVFSSGIDAWTSVHAHAKSHHSLIAPRQPLNYHSTVSCVCTSVLVWGNCHLRVQLNVR